MCGDAPKIQTITHPVARRDHWCCECRSAIPRGDKHELTCGLWDGKWSSFRTCFACCEVREELGLDCYTFGELFDECTDPEDGPTEHARRVLQRQQWRKERLQAERMERHWRDRRGVGIVVEVVSCTPKIEQVQEPRYPFDYNEYMGNL